MKLPIYILLIIYFFILSLQAEEKDGLLQAYQRELTHLSSQKVQLESSQKEVAQANISKANLIKLDLEKLSKELAHLQVENESASEKLLIQEKDLKMNLNSKSQLEALWKRVNAGIAKTQDFIKLQKESGNKVILPDNTSLLSFATIKDAVMLTLNQATHIESQEVAYYSQAGNLVESEIVRWGALAAFAKNGDELSLLAPAEQSILQVLPLKNDAKFSITAKLSNLRTAFIPMYLFDSLAEQGHLIKPATLADHIMRILPGVLLLGLFLLVISLFVSLARH